MKKKICFGIKLVLTGMFVLHLTPVPHALAHTMPDAENQAELEQASDRIDRIRRMNRLETHRAGIGIRHRATYKLRKTSMTAAGFSPGATARALFGGPNRAYPYNANPELGSVGKKQTLTVLIDFPDQPAATLHPGITAQSVFENVYSDGTSAAKQHQPYDSVSAYYRRASEGKLEITGDVLGWARLDNNRGNYEPDYPNGATEHQKLLADNQAIFDLVAEALQKMDATTDFSKYDNDHDGDIDLITILYSGPNNGWGGFWWAYRWEFFIESAFSKRFDNKRLKQFVFQYVNARANNSTDYNPQTLIHEFGHALGLPDYYDYCPTTRFETVGCGASINHPGPDGGVGGLDIMAHSRGNHSAFNRWLLDWTEPTVIKSGQEARITLVPSGSGVPGTKAVALFPGSIQSNAPGQELFLVENRTRVGNDGGIAGMPADGLLIWHIEASPNLSNDDFSFDNSYTPLKLLRLVRAQTPNDFIATELANAQDYYVVGSEFSPNSTPSSAGYGNSATGITVTDIVFQGNNITATFKVPGPTQPNSLSATPFVSANNNNIVETTGQTGAVTNIEELDAIYYEYQSKSPDELAEAWESTKFTLADVNSNFAAAIRAEILLKQWALKDGQSAAEAVLDLINEEVAQEYFRQVMSAWANNNPQSAADWYFSKERAEKAKDRSLVAGENFSKALFRWRALSEYETAAREIDSLLHPEEIFGAIAGLLEGANATGARSDDLLLQIQRLGVNATKAQAVFDARMATEMVWSEFQIDRQRVDSLNQTLRDALKSVGESEGLQ